MTEWETDEPARRAGEREGRDRDADAVNVRLATECVEHLAEGCRHLRAKPSLDFYDGISS